MFTEVDLYKRIKTYYSPYGFKRFIMGAWPLGEYFHKIYNIIRDVPDCANISDNIWVWCKTTTKHLEELDHLLTFLKRSGITLRHQKCLFAFPEN